MPLYEYACRKCGHSEDRLQRDLALSCPECDSLLHRQWGFAVKEAWQPHFNHSVGKYVSNRGEFNDALKRGGDAAGSSFVSVEHGDLPRNEEGMETTRKLNHDMKVTK